MTTMPDSGAEAQGSLSAALQSCAEEAIHQIGTLQPVGVLLAVDEQRLMLRMASDNLGALFPLSAEGAIGLPLAALIGYDQAHNIGKLATQESWPGSLICSIEVRRDGRDTAFDAYVYRSAGLIVIEIEMDAAGDGDAFHRQFIPIRDSLWKLDAEQDMQRYSQAVVEEVRLLSGFDRVMMYRFDPSWDGEVIAESRVDGTLSYLGNHFPASDIPAQARALYTRNLVRLIADVDSPALPIRRGAAPLPPLDMSLSWLRSMSPVHVQYLRNMGVRASLSISLVQNKRLWGLIACHHFSPKYVPLRSREMNEFIGRMVSLKLGAMENAERGVLQARIRTLLQGLTKAIRLTHNLDSVIKSCQADFLGLVRAGGAVISIAGIRHKIGQVPTDNGLRKILRALKEQPPSEVYYTEHLAALLPLDAGLRQIAGGLMIAPLERSQKNFVMWFRPEVPRTQYWAGQPEKQVVRDAAGRPHISPRLSFETWMETSSDRSLPWTQVETDAAAALSLALIEVVTQHALKSSEASYRLLAENSTDLIALLDTQGHLLFVSPASEQMFGLEPAAMQGHALQDWVLAKDQPLVTRMLAECVAGAARCTRLLHCSRQDGRALWVEASLQRKSDSDGSQIIVLNARDVTQRHTYQLAIEEVHKRNAHRTDTPGEGLLSLNGAGDIVYANELAGGMLGVEPSHLVGRAAFDTLYGQKPAQAVAPETNVLNTLQDGETRQGSMARPATAAPLHYVCTPLFEGAAIVGAVLVLRLVGRGGAAAQEQSIEAVMVTNAEGLITSVNRGFTEITGYPAEEVIGQTPGLLKSGMHTPQFYQEISESLRLKQCWTGETWNRRKNGEIYPQRGSVTAIVDGDGKAQSYVAVFADVSKARQAEEKLYFQAKHDALTGLPNRLHFSEQLEMAIDKARHSGGKLALVFIDLDRFKEVNDTHGHAAGDRYLRMIAERLLPACRKEDSLARWGGDEFVIILEDIAEQGAINSTITRLQRSLSTALILDGQELLPTASMGVSFYPMDGNSAEALIKAADSAMYRAKARGRNQHAFFSVELSHGQRERFNIGTELRRALQQGELCLHYQPQIRAGDGHLMGAEALLRWQHPSRGLLPPLQFLPVAEALGMMDELGLWVLGAACAQMRQWLEQGVPIPRVAIKVAPSQLNENFTPLVEHALASARLEPGQLELEITEGALVAGESLKKALTSLCALKIPLSLHDFGTGSASLGHIKQFPVTRFKIDKSLIEGIPENPADVAIVRAFLVLASSLGVDVVAEGVETFAQFDFLRKSGISHIQGHFSGKPMPAEALARFAFRLQKAMDPASPLKPDELLH